KSINWILKTISDIWLIAFIIIFQTEIRKLLLLITHTKIFRFFVKSKISETIEELEEAIEELSKSHIGALIILPRTQNVMMSIGGGVTLQANVTKELIASIFNPKSPLHDGAIVIDNQVITNARCTLPLANDIKKNGKNLGMRHKAALGLTQMVDAIVIVVSEETGRISIADGDDLMYDIKFNELSKIIKDKLNVKN
ncbi:MAG: diadenylate cyclase, partial [Candidatus Kapaibacteriota bacterium]